MTEITCYDDYCTWNEDHKCTCEKITLRIDAYDKDDDQSAISKCQQYKLFEGSNKK